MKFFTIAIALAALTDALNLDGVETTAAQTWADALT